MKPLVAKAASAWFARLVEGDLSYDEREALHHWTEADDDHRSALADMDRMWQAIDAIADCPEIIAARADALESMRAGNARRWAVSRRGWQSWRWPRMASAMVAALVLAMVGLWQFHGARPQQYATQNGERRVIRLADGSRVTMDADTRIDVAFSDRRRALRLLSGRARFDVAHNPARPFSVTAAGRTIIATGTAFSVEAMASRVEVVLYQGKVAVRDAASNQPVRLSGGRGGVAAEARLVPGGMLVIPANGAGARIAAVSPVVESGWERGELTFADVPLGVAVQRINRYATIPIEVRGGATDLPVSGTFASDQADGFADAVRQLYQLRLSRTGRRIVIEASAEK